MLKYLAVVSAIVLVGGYVLLKAGGGRAIMPSTKSGRVVSEEPERDTTLMPGSKSSAPFTSNARLDTQVPQDREMMSSSKSLSPVIRSEDLRSPGATQPTSQPTDRSK